MSRRAVSRGGVFSAVVSAVLLVALAGSLAFSGRQLVVSLGGSFGWQVAEYAVVFVTVLLAEFVGLLVFGRWLRRKARAERLAARNAAIRAGAGSSALL